MSRPGVADLHVHTSYSDGWPTPGRLYEHAGRDSGLDILAVTDHDTIEGALRMEEVAAADPHQRLGVIVGEEVSTRDGHVIGLFLEKRVRPGLSAAATVDLIHDQGGIAIAAHPFWRTEHVARRLGGPVHGVGWLAAEIEFDAVEVENSCPGLGVANLIARRFAAGAGVPVVGGSDAHILSAVGRAATQFPGRTPKALRSAILAGLTRPVRRRYSVRSLLGYAAWGVHHDRVPTVMAQVPA